MESKNYQLRDFSSGDLEDLYKGLSNPQVNKFYGISFKTKADARKQLNWYSELEINHTGEWWVICPGGSSLFMGAIGLNNVNKTHKKAEIGFWLLPPYQSKGIIREVLPLIINFGFIQLNLHRIEAYVERENQNSKIVLSRFGFRHEGTMYDCEFKNDRFIDLDIYALLKTD